MGAGTRWLESFLRSIKPGNTGALGPEGWPNKAVERSGMSAWARGFGLSIGLIIIAYGGAVMHGLAQGPIPCRAKCGIDYALVIYFGEPRAHLIIGMQWAVVGFALCIISLLASRRSPKIERRRRNRSRNRSRKRKRLVGKQ